MRRQRSFVGVLKREGTDLEVSVARTRGMQRGKLVVSRKAGSGLIWISDSSIACFIPAGYGVNRAARTCTAVAVIFFMTILSVKIRR